MQSTGRRRGPPGGSWRSGPSPLISGFVGIVYVGVGFLVIFALLLLFHRLSSNPGVSSQPGMMPTSGVADEAERWLRAQR